MCVVRAYHYILCYAQTKFYFKLTGTDRQIEIRHICYDIICHDEHMLCPYLTSLNMSWRYMSWRSVSWCRMPALFWHFQEETYALHRKTLKLGNTAVSPSMLQLFCSVASLQKHVFSQNNSSLGAIMFCCLGIFLELIKVFCCPMVRIVSLQEHQAGVFWCHELL